MITWNKQQVQLYLDARPHSIVRLPSTPQDPDGKPDAFIIDDPQKLYFYTRFFPDPPPTDAAITDHWPAVASVDFPDRPEPRVSTGPTHDPGGSP